MLGSKTKTASTAGFSNQSGMSIIGPDVTIIGNLSATGDVQLDGNVEGDISCAAFTLGSQGRVKGHVSAQKAQLAGHVEGTIDVRELSVAASARIAGDMSYENVSIAAGAHVDGRVTHRAAGDENNPLQLVAHTMS